MQKTHKPPSQRKRIRRENSEDSYADNARIYSGRPLLFVTGTLQFLRK